MQITDAIMPYQFLITALFAMILEANPYMKMNLSDVIWSTELIGNILITCVFAIGVNIITYFLIGKTSAVTYQVIGHFKTIMTLIGGYYLFGNY